MVKVNDFARELSEKYGLSLSDASDFITMMFDVAKEELNAPDSSVKIKGFGTFKVSAVGARASVDVNTGERIIIDGRNKISFTPEVLLRDRVNRPFVQFETVVLNDGVDFSEIDAEYAEQDEPTTDETEVATEAEPIATAEQSTTIVEQPTVITEPSTVATEQPTTIVAAPEAVVPTDIEPQPAEEATPRVEPTASVDAEPAETQSEKREAEPTSNTVNTDEYRDTARRLMTPTSESAETASVASAQSGEVVQPKSATSPPDADEADSVASGCRQRSPRLMYVLSVASFLLLVILGVGMYFLYMRIEEKNNVIDRLEDRLYAQTDSVATTQTPPATTPPAANVNANAAQEDSLSATAKTEKAAVATAQRDSVATKTHSKAAVTTPSDYNYDVRVRTGAYIIVGVAKTITVQSGQTLASISRAYLGDGMECYVEVLNNRTTVKPGDKLKIPELKLKPRRN